MSEEFREVKAEERCYAVIGIGKTFYNGTAGQMDRVSTRQTKTQAMELVLEFKLSGSYSSVGMYKEEKVEDINNWENK